MDGSRKSLDFANAWNERVWRYAFIAVFALCICFWLGSAMKPDRSQAVAAWVQAVGSVLAIVGAYAIGERQADISLENSRQIAEEEQHKRKRAIFSVCEVAMDRTNQVTAMFDRHGGDRLGIIGEYHESIMGGPIKVLHEIDPMILATPESISAFIEFRLRLGLLQANIEGQLYGPAEKRAPPDGAIRNIQTIKRPIDAFYVMIRSAYGDSHV